MPGSNSSADRLMAESANSALTKSDVLERLAVEVPSARDVSNSWSGGDGELDEVPAVGDPAHIVQIGRDHRVLTGEGQRRVALQ